MTQVAGAVAGGLAAAAYLDAKFLIRHDLATGSAKSEEKKALQFVTERFGQGKGFVYDYFEEHALGKNGDNPCLICDGKSWTYKQFYDDVQRVGNWLMHDLHVERGEVVALDAPNSPEYVMIAVAISAIGASAAYINNHLTATPMIHSVKLCGARLLLADREVQALVAPCELELRYANVKTVYFDETSIAGLSDGTRLPITRRKGVDPTATLRLIYTSGTTGLPKGARCPTSGSFSQERRSASISASSPVCACIPASQSTTYPATASASCHVCTAVPRSSSAADSHTKHSGPMSENTKRT